MADLATDSERNRPVVGVAWMLLTMLLFVSMDTLAKYLTQSYPPPMVVWARYAGHFVVVAAFLNVRLRATMVTGRLRFQILRSLLLFVTTLLFFIGLSLNPLAVCAAMMFVTPLLVTVMAAPLLGEHVGPRRIAGVVIGFLGAVAIIRPGTEAFRVEALLPLAAAFTYALYLIATRRISATDSHMTTLFYTALGGTVAATIGLPWYWATPVGAVHWAIFGVVGVLGALGQYTLIRAFHAAPAPVVTPFQYTNLIWATLFGFALFGDLPDRWTVVGALVIVGSGLYILHREQRARAAA